MTARRCVMSLFALHLPPFSRSLHFTTNEPPAVVYWVGEATLYTMHSGIQYDYYKFPDGGIENGENPMQAMIRETREESGLVVFPDTVREYGYVHRIQKSDRDETECFVQDNYCYFCKTADGVVPQKLDGYEAKETYTLEYVDPNITIRKNRHVMRSPYNQMMFEREARVLELLITEELFNLTTPN